MQTQTTKGKWLQLFECKVFLTFKCFMMTFGSRGHNDKIRVRLKQTRIDEISAWAGIKGETRHRNETDSRQFLFAFCKIFPSIFFCVQNMQY